MKKFLITSSILLLVALILVVGVYWYVTLSVESSQQSATHHTASSSVVETNSDTSSAETAETAQMPSQGIPLRDLPLTEGQKEAVALVGIDVETFVITPAMQICAEEKLGSVRMQTIVAGETPTFMETTRLIPCLNVD